MSLQGKPLEAITEADFQGLIENQVRESQTLEYKRDPYGRGDEQVREMLRDISSLANAFGGDLLIGIGENEEGVAVDILGIENAEQEATRIISSSVSNLQERILGLRAWPAPIEGGRHVIVVRIPRSLRAPHMVTFKGLNQSWIRHDRQKSPMSIQEIREARLRVEGLMPQVDRFRKERKIEILPQTGSSPCYIVSATPIFVNTEVLDVGDRKLRHLLEHPPDQRQGGFVVGFDRATSQPTLHGLTIGYEGWKHVELFRNGHLELWVEGDSLLDRSVKIGDREFSLLRALALCEYPVSLFRLGKAIYSYLGLNDPVVISVSMYNIQGLALAKDAGDGIYLELPGYVTPCREKYLEIPPGQVTSLDEPDKVAKRFVDRIWQAFGYERAPFFDDEGTFRLQ